MRNPRCGECGGNARLVPDGYGKKWLCKCGAWAKAHTATDEPLTGVAKTGLHQKRERLQKALERSGITTDVVRQRMGLKPWQFRVNEFTHAQCEQALEIAYEGRPVLAELDRLLS